MFQSKRKAGPNHFKHFPIDFLQQKSAIGSHNHAAGDALKGCFFAHLDLNNFGRTVSAMEKERLLRRLQLWYFSSHVNYPSRMILKLKRSIMWVSVSTNTKKLCVKILGFCTNIYCPILLFKFDIQARIVGPFDTRAVSMALVNNMWNSGRSVFVTCVDFKLNNQPDIFISPSKTILYNICSSNFSLKKMNSCSRTHFFLEMIITHISYGHHFMPLIFLLYFMITLIRMWIKALLVSLHQFLNTTSPGSIPETPNQRSLKKLTQISQTIKICIAAWLSTTLTVQFMILLLGGWISQTPINTHTRAWKAKTISLFPTQQMSHSHCFHSHPSVFKYAKATMSCFCLCVCKETTHSWNLVTKKYGLKNKNMLYIIKLIHPPGYYSKHFNCIIRISTEIWTKFTKIRLHLCTTYNQHTTGISSVYDQVKRNYLHVSAVETALNQSMKLSLLIFNLWKFHKLKYPMLFFLAWKILRNSMIDFTSGRDWIITNQDYYESAQMMFSKQVNTILDIKFIEKKGTQMCACLYITLYATTTQRLVLRLFKLCPSRANNIIVSLLSFWIDPGGALKPSPCRCLRTLALSIIKRNIFCGFFYSFLFCFTGLKNLTELIKVISMKNLLYNSQTSEVLGDLIKPGDLVFVSFPFAQYQFLLTAVKVMLEYLETVATLTFLNVLTDSMSTLIHFNSLEYKGTDFLKWREHLLLLIILSSMALKIMASGVKYTSSIPLIVACYKRTGYYPATSFLIMDVNPQKGYLDFNTGLPNQLIKVIEGGVLL
ncbi:hypothetical protein VP01_628g5 [Puccinia sorghi]|uniref:Uncharacterized protein n=1 Tax=Puccinia sorghi TaxID=27349 RepID=A0A0L6UGE7_9BASI|nr:hypothetical protein VP01_628g5 [Puccinia sorghi]